MCTVGCPQPTKRPPAVEINGLVHSAERRKLVSAHMPLHYNRVIPVSCRRIGMANVLGFYFHFVNNAQGLKLALRGHYRGTFRRS